MSDTPRTDASIPKGHINPAMTDYVPASFARALERELVVERERVKKEWLAPILASRNSEIESLRAQLTEAQRQIELLRLYGNKDCTSMADDAIAAERGG